MTLPWPHKQNPLNSTHHILGLQKVMCILSGIAYNWLGGMTGFSSEGQMSFSISSLSEGISPVSKPSCGDPQADTEEIMKMVIVQVRG